MSTNTKPFWTTKPYFDAQYDRSTYRRAMRDLKRGPISLETRAKTKDRARRALTRALAIETAGGYLNPARLP